ncbi:MAG: hypothetical protein F6K58_08695 [Symploca sp. SIO2E9]|nr:hypothetical protein [Symploca sp. SIO2E9]
MLRVGESKNDLKPVVEARLIAQAAAKGVSIEIYLESVIEDLLISPPLLSSMGGCKYLSSSQSERS